MGVLLHPVSIIQSVRLGFCSAPCNWRRANSHSALCNWPRANSHDLTYSARHCELQSLVIRSFRHFASFAGINFKTTTIIIYLCRKRDFKHCWRRRLEYIWLDLRIELGIYHLMVLLPAVRNTAWCSVRASVIVVVQNFDPECVDSMDTLTDSGNGEYMSTLQVLDKNFKNLSWCLYEIYSVVSRNSSICISEAISPRIRWNTQKTGILIRTCCNIIILSNFTIVWSPDGEYVWNFGDRKVLSPNKAADVLYRMASNFFPEHINICMAQLWIALAVSSSWRQPANSGETFEMALWQYSAHRYVLAME